MNNDQKFLLEAYNKTIVKNIFDEPVTYICNLVKEESLELQKHYKAGDLDEHQAKLRLIQVVIDKLKDEMYF
jgi:hypothetical protein